MTQIMTATKITDKQIKDAVKKFEHTLREHRSEIPSDVARQILAFENLGMLMFAPFRERAEAVSNLIVRMVTVNRSRSPQEALEATGREQYTDRKVMDAMPKGEGNEVVEVVFFTDRSKLDSFMSNDDLENEFDLHGLKPADPFSVAAVNEADPAFADKRRHLTHWKNAEGDWCCIQFGNCLGHRSVWVNNRGDGDSNLKDDKNGSFNGVLWFAGIRK